MLFYFTQKNKMSKLNSNKFVKQYPQLVERDYLVTIYEVHDGTVIVKAISEEDAKQKAADVIAESEIETIYSHTMDPAEWVVQEYE